MAFDVVELRATMTPATPLLAGFYTAILSSAVADYSGNTPAESVQWAFEVRDPNEWISTGGGAWSMRDNWSEGAIQEEDALLIDVPGEVVTTTLGSVNASILNLISEEDLHISQRNLSVRNSATINGHLRWTAQSVLDGGGMTFANGGLLIDGTFGNTPSELDVSGKLQAKHIWPIQHWKS